MYPLRMYAHGHGGPCPAGEKEAGELIVPIGADVRPGGRVQAQLWGSERSAYLLSPLSLTDSTAFYIHRSAYESHIRDSDERLPHGSSSPGTGPGFCSWSRRRQVKFATIQEERCALPRTIHPIRRMQGGPPHGEFDPKSRYVWFFEPDFCTKAWCRCGVRRRRWPVIGL
jgi:hypothetical protein